MDPSDEKEEDEEEEESSGDEEDDNATFVTDEAEPREGAPPPDARAFIPTHAHQSPWVHRQFPARPQERRRPRTPTVTEADQKDASASASWEEEKKREQSPLPGMMWQEYTDALREVRPMPLRQEQLRGREPDFKYEDVAQGRVPGGGRNANRYRDLTHVEFRQDPADYLNAAVQDANLEPSRLSAHAGAQVAFDQHRRWWESADAALDTRVQLTQDAVARRNLNLFLNTNPSAATAALTDVTNRILGLTQREMNLVSAHEVERMTDEEMQDDIWLEWNAISRAGQPRVPARQAYDFGLIPWQPNTDYATGRLLIPEHGPPATGVFQHHPRQFYTDYANQFPPEAYEAKSFALISRNSNEPERGGDRAAINSFTPLTNQTNFLVNAITNQHALGLSQLEPQVPTRLSHHDIQSLGRLYPRVFEPHGQATADAPWASQPLSNAVLGAIMPPGRMRARELGLPYRRQRPPTRQDLLSDMGSNRSASNLPEWPVQWPVGRRRRNRETTPAEDVETQQDESKSKKRKD